MKKVILGLTVLVGAASAACASATAKAAPERPPLEVPAPPPRVVEPSPQPPTPPEPVPELPPQQPASSRPPRQTAARDTAKPDPKQDTATTTDTAAPAPPPVAPAPQLRQPGAADPSEAAKQVQSLIDHATKSLGSVNTKGFNKASRAVYENARGLLLQAQEALKKSDFDNAKKLAEKVESTARELGGK